MKYKTIVVTGSHRSGSTWVGKIIGQHPTIKYVHEPFNLKIQRFDKPLNFWFEHISGQSNPEKQEAVLYYLKSFSETSPSFILENLRRISSIKGVYKFFVDFFRRFTTKDVLIKDPIAFMSAEWIYQKFNAKMIVTIRHPAAFVASIKLKNWEFDFNEFLKQELIIKNYLFDFREILEEYAKNPPDIIDQGILLWNIFHHVIIKYQENYSNNWFFIKHEDLSYEPLKYFTAMFDYIDLEMTEKISKEIIDSTTADENTTLRRNSKENIKSWKKRLTVKEISRIKEKTYPIWPLFYEEKDW